MHYVGGALAIAAGVFSSMGLHELGVSGAELCQYESAFCDKPVYLLVAAGLAAARGAFVSVRYPLGSLIRAEDVHGMGHKNANAENDESAYYRRKHVHFPTPI